MLEYEDSRGMFPTDLARRFPVEVAREAPLPWAEAPEPRFSMIPGVWRGSAEAGNLLDDIALKVLYGEATNTLGDRLSLLSPWRDNVENPGILQ